MKKTILKSELLKEDMYKCEFDNGLIAFVVPKKEYTKKYAIYSTKYGSIDSKFKVPGDDEYTIVPDGIAHFLEHKMFDMPYGNAMDALTSLGASANAYTSFDHTAYLFSCTDNFYESFKILLDYVQLPYFPEESVENEKGIIGQEIRMYEDDPDWQVFFNFLKAMYRDNPIIKDIAGTCESISHINSKLLTDCHKTFYHPSNMIICVVGNVEPDEVFNMIWDNQVNKEKVPEIKRIEVEEPKEVVNPYIEKNMLVGLPMFVMGFKQDMSVFKKFSKTEYSVGMDIILDVMFGKSSNTYKYLYENGLINGYLDVNFDMDRDGAYSSISGESKDAEKVREVIMAEVERVKNEGIDRATFERIRKMQLGMLMKSFNSVQNIAQQFVSLYFKNIFLFDYIKAYEDMDFETVNKILDTHFSEERFAMSVVKN